MRRGSHPRRSKQQYELVSSTDLDAFADAEAEAEAQGEYT
jgi:hypothetical protein